MARLRWGILDSQTDTVEDLITAINGVPFDGSATNTGAALNLAADQLTNSDRDDNNFPDVCVVFTDGLVNQPTDTAESTDPDLLRFAVPNTKDACE